MINLGTLNALVKQIKKRGCVSNQFYQCYNTVVGFDIETTNFYYNGEKVSFPYLWQIGTETCVCVGRKIESFYKFCEKLSKKLMLHEKKFLIIYVYNLEFEFQFIHRYFKWLKVFADQARQVMYAKSDLYIIFKCACRLSGQVKLESIGKKIGFEKTTLNYALLRNTKTKIETSELEYAIRDVIITCKQVKFLLKQYNDNLITIPLTSTGYIRRHIRDICLKARGYKEKMQKLTIDADTYNLLKDAYTGGFCHANPIMRLHNKYFENVYSMDITSSYPNSLCAEKYPMSTPYNEKNLAIDNLEKHILNERACLFYVLFEGVKTKNPNVNILSFSKCLKCTNPILDNGRIVCADSILTAFTELDYINFITFYNIKSMKINKLYVFEKDYLPKEYIRAILDLYSRKTQIKGVHELSEEYDELKKLINAIYGMNVTDIVRPDIQYRPDLEKPWETQNVDINIALNAYHNLSNRFTFYPWGVWCTAYSRSRLLKMLHKLDPKDFLYCDTDSLKFVNDYSAEFDKDNKMNYNKLLRMCNRYQIPCEKISPVTHDGKKLPLGDWTPDENTPYIKFKALNSKRYIYHDSKNKFHVTIAGTSKELTADYLITKYKNNVYNKFDNDLIIPVEYTGKLTHTYIDEEKNAILVDYSGTAEKIYVKSGIHLEGVSYKISRSDDESVLDLMLGSYWGGTKNVKKQILFTGKN